MGGATATLDYDAELMLRVKAGDDASFGALLEKHRSPIVHFLYRMVQNQAIAEELAQEAFLRVYRSRATYEPTAKFTTWLFRIASHVALNWLRDARNEKDQPSLEEAGEGYSMRHADQHPSAEQELVRGAVVAEIRGAVAALPPRQRAAVLMHKYEDMDYSQIAHALNTTESAVKSLLFRAYEALRARLAAVSGL
jgi:RNA polymerase sigma-70 factor (ECF subfamily)